MSEPAPDLKRGCIELMNAAEAVYVTTLDAGGFPCTRAMFNLRRNCQFPGLAGIFEGHEKDFLVYLSTNTSSEKVRQVRANPKASLYYCKASEFDGLMLSGCLEVVHEPEIKRTLWQENWTLYYPGGPGDEDYTVLRMLPRKARGWRSFRRFEFELNGQLS